MKKVLAIILAALQLCFVLAACSNSNAPADTDPVAESDSKKADETTAAPETEPLTEAEKRALVDDELPDDKTFGGREYTVLTTKSREKLYVVEEQTGVTLDDAIYDRNITVENDYQVKIKDFLLADRHACRAAIQQACSSGDTEAFDLVSYHMVDNSANAVAGLYLNWHDIPYIDFEKPWWSDSNLEDLTINDKCFIALGDVVISAVRGTWCYLVNKDMAKDAGVEDLYQLARDGKWTLDKAGEIIDQVYRDTNANGSPDLGDTFGIAAYIGSPMNTYLWACDNPIIHKDDQGTPQYTLYTDKLPDIVAKVVEMHSVKPGAYKCSGADTTSHQKLFESGGSLFLNGTLYDMILRSSVSDFSCGLIPYPKFDEAQTEYYTMIDGGADSMGVALIESGEDVAFIGLITEALCAESYKQVYPVFYDSMLKGRYADMPEDAEMIDIIVNGRVFDIGYIYDNWFGAGFWMQNLVSAGNTNVASYYESRWSSVEDYYDTVLDIFETED